MVTPAARREAVAHLEERLEVSERRACSIIAADRSVVRYLSRRPDDAALRARLRELADQRRRFGYRRLHILLRSEGWSMNRKKTQRLYGEEGLAVRRRTSRRRIAVARTPIPKPKGPNSRWSTDFVHDQLANGRRFRVLTIIDDVTRECLAAVPDTSLSGKRVVREMDALIARRSRPGAAGPAQSSYVRNKSRREASDHGASVRPDTFKMVAQAGSAVKKRSLP